jgi:PEP-CTERM motif
LNAPADWFGTFNIQHSTIMNTTHRQRSIPSATNKVLLIFAVISTLATPVAATQVNGTFAGTALSANNYLTVSNTAFGIADTALPAGTSVTGSFSYDTSNVLDSNASADIGYYQGVAGQISFHAGSYNYTSSGLLNFEIIKGLSQNSIRIIDPSNSPNDFSAVLEVQLSNALGSDALPVNWGTPLVTGGLSQVSTVYSASGTSNGTNLGHDYRFTTTSVQAIAVVPEPETYALMMAGLGILGFMAKRRKQS